MTLWNSNLLHNQIYGAIPGCSYTLDFFSDAVSRQVVSLNAIINYEGEEHLLENVITGMQNNLYGTLVALGIDIPNVIDICESIMDKLYLQGFRVRKIVVT